KKQIPHNVLNAKHHAKEAEIIAEAGRPGTVTIATNMAGRGTDIVLGGKLLGDVSEAEEAAWRARHELVLAAGGLRVVGTERHESRRIDNQLRGRSGRQGDPGATQFYLSLEDNLMRMFVPDAVRQLMTRGFQPGEAIVSSIVTRAIESAQRRVEGHNFDMRKQLLDFDDVANEQRQVIYQQRNELLEADSIKDFIQQSLEDCVLALVLEHCPENSMPENWDLKALNQRLEREFKLNLDLEAWFQSDPSVDTHVLHDRLLSAFNQVWAEKENLMGSESMRGLEKHLMLNVLDMRWKEHLATMEHLRQGIHLRGYAQKDPKQEYKREAFLLFQNLLENIKLDGVRVLIAIQTQNFEARSREVETKLEYRHDAVQAIPTGDSDTSTETAEASRTYERASEKVGRNESCPCGSGKKYKHCHGRI
ncbi:MAG: SEC-C metal-binding domain-containing protein, partial [Gammaproteobacteria bacterium]